MNIFILGAAGFVGQAYLRLFERIGLAATGITRLNYASMVGQRCDLLINANGNSKKFLSDRDPVGEFDASVVSVVRSLVDFPADRYVFLSSGDVYPDQSSPIVTDEDQILDTEAMSRYGLHKYLAETVVRSTHRHALVIRMGGFVGPGLHKNAIFDLLHNQPVWLKLDSELQFLSTDRAAALVWKLVEKQVVGETVNLGGLGTVRIGDFFDRLQSQSELAQSARYVRFELSTAKLSRLIGTYPPHSRDEVEAFLASEGR